MKTRTYRSSSPLFTIVSLALFGTLVMQLLPYNFNNAYAGSAPNDKAARQMLLNEPTDNTSDNTIAPEEPPIDTRVALPVITSFAPDSGGTGTVVTITGDNLTEVVGVKFGGIDAAGFEIISAAELMAEVGSGATGKISVTTANGTMVESFADFTFIEEIPEPTSTPTPTPIPVMMPTITSFTPESGSTGTEVTITGDNLTEVVAVKFGGIDASNFESISATQLMAVVGSGATGAVMVTTSNGTVESPTRFIFLEKTPVTLPAITSFTPESGRTGTEVTITGDNLTEVVAVKFGGVDASSFESISVTQLTALVGRGATGKVSITTSNSTIAESFTNFTFIDEIPRPTSNATANRVVIQVKPDEDAELVSSDGNITIRIPKGAVSTPVEVTFVQHAVWGSTGIHMINLFEVNAHRTDNKELVSTFNKEIEITIRHQESDLRGLDIDSITLFNFDENTKGWMPVTSEFNPKDLTLVASTDHFSIYGEMANPLNAGPGRITESQVDLHAGAASFSYPIELPPGPGGFQPELTLTYNSASVNEMKNKQSVGSWVGIGWTLNPGSVSCDLSTDTYFLELNSISYPLFYDNDNDCYYTQPQSYLKLEETQYGDYKAWDVYDRDGNYYRFGGTQDSVQYTWDGISTPTYRYDLSLIRDTNGNEATISYVKDTFTVYDESYMYTPVRAAYPEYLKYSDNKCVVHFNSSWDINDQTYGHLRYDNPGYAQGAWYPEPPKIMDTRRLDSIEIIIDPTQNPGDDILVRKYVFDYNTTNSTLSEDYNGIYYAGVHTLTDLTQLGSDNTSLPGMSFSYQDYEIYRSDSATEEYEGNPGNPASLSWPYLTVIDNGYGGMVNFSYDQKPDGTPSDIWTRVVVDSKEIDAGIGPSENITYTYDNGPAYLWQNSWSSKYRGFGEVTERAEEGNYTKHHYYTTGELDEEDAEKLTGREYKTEWFNSDNVSLREQNNNWSWEIVARNTEFECLSWIGYDGAPYEEGEYIKSPVAIAADDGFVYVLDVGHYDTYSETYTPRVVRYDLDGSYVHEIGYDEYNGTYGYGEYIRTPVGVAAADGYIYVLDVGHYDTYGETYTPRVVVYSDNGTYEGEIGYDEYNGPYGYGEYIRTPVGVAAADGYIYVLDVGHYDTYGETYTPRVVVYSDNGTYEGEIGYDEYNGPYGYGEYIRTPVGVAAADGYIYVLDVGHYDTYGETYTPRVVVYSDNGTYEGEIGYDEYNGPYGYGEYITAPHGVAVSDSFVYALDEYQEYVPRVVKYDGVLLCLAIELDETSTTINNKTSSISFEYDDYGNITTEYLDGDTTTNDDDATVHRVFNPNTSANILSTVARERVYATITGDVGGANLKKETLYYYDGNNTSLFTAPDAGNLTRLVVSASSTDNMSSYYTYDGWGNRISETDFNGSTANWTYEDDFHTYPETKTFPAVGEDDPLTESYTYEPGTNNLKTITDANSQTTEYDYDAFQRLIEIDNPSGRDPDIVYEYVDWGTLNDQHILIKTYYDASNYLWQRQFFDGLGRILQVHAEGDAGHTIVSSTTAYNDRGLVHKEYVSQDIASENISYQTPGESWRYVSYDYDALGRATTQTNADNTTITHDYSSAWQDLVTNVRGYKTRYHYDAFQRLVEVEELDDNDDLYATTTYEYDVLGNLVEVEDNDSNVTSMTYDWLSRKTTMDDPDMGNWSYEYDGNGNLISQTDAKDQTIEFAYDELNRLTDKTYSSANITAVSYLYDDGTNGKGRRTSMSDASGDTTYSYDARGRLYTENRSIEGDWYLTSFTYDGLDRIATITYPTGEEVTQEYNDRGLPCYIYGSVAGDLVTDTLYNSLGQITDLILDNSLKTTYGYYGTGGDYDTTGGYYGRLWEIKTLPQTGGDPLQDIVHTWDAGGNLIQRETLTQPNSDNSSPSAVSNLAAGNPTPNSLTLTWTAPGDDGSSGTASQYDIRYSTSTINDGNWASASQATGETSPQIAGSSENFTVTGLSDNTTYYFALKTADEVSNWSAISNIPSGSTSASGPVVIISISTGSDTTVPAAVSNLAAGSPTSNSLTLTWTSPGDDGSSGTASQYDIRYSTSTINDGNWASASQATGETTPQIAGSSENFTVTGLSINTTYYFALKTADEVPNWSAISNIPNGATSASGPVVIITISTSFDTIDPAAVSNLAAGSPMPNSLTLTWTSPGDDGSTGTASQYDIRYSTSTINDGNWASASQATAETSPQIAGSSENFTVNGLSDNTTYYFALKTADEVSNWSAVSNVPSDNTTAGGSATFDTETFTYDFLDRLLSVSGAYSENFTYTEIGNIKSMNSDNYTYPDNHIMPHAVSQVGNNNYTYDDNGNMTSRPDQTLTWDVENRLIGVDTPTDNVTFVYDGDGNRLKKTENGETILYVNKYYEKNLTTGAVTTYYYLGGTLVAKRSNTTLNYIHQDHLTGTSATTDSNGAETGNTCYFPFGTSRASSGTLPDQKFTGQRLDDTGLYYYGARYYDPSIGRFISSDPIVKSLASPQSLNRYTYVLNNPLKYIDPVGLAPIGVAYRGDETYILEELNGEYRVVGTNQGVSGWYSSRDALEEAWGGCLEQYSGSGSWEYWQVNDIHEILVYDKDFYGNSITITLVPEGSDQATHLSKRGTEGLSTPGGTYVRYELGRLYNNVEILIEVIRHEWYHSYERETQGMLFDINYQFTILSLNNFYDFSGKSWVTGWHNVHPDEVQARAYSGVPAYPYPIPPPNTFSSWVLTVY